MSGTSPDHPASFQGELFDLVLSFEFERDGGVDLLQLPYNVSDEPLSIARRFALNNGISLRYVDYIHTILVSKRNQVWEARDPSQAALSSRVAARSSPMLHQTTTGRHNVHSYQSQPAARDAWLPPNQTQISEGYDELTYYHQQLEKQQHRDDAYLSLTGELQSLNRSRKLFDEPRERTTGWRKLDPAHLRTYGRTISQRLASFEIPLTGPSQDIQQTITKPVNQSTTPPNIAQMACNDMHFARGLARTAPPNTAIDLTHFVVDPTRSGVEDSEYAPQPLARAGTPLWIPANQPQLPPQNSSYGRPEHFERGVPESAYQELNSRTPSHNGTNTMTKSSRCIPCWISHTVDCLSDSYGGCELPPDLERLVTYYNDLTVNAYQTETQVAHLMLEVDQAQHRVVEQLQNDVDHRFMGYGQYRAAMRKQSTDGAPISFFVPNQLQTDRLKIDKHAQLCLSKEHRDICRVRMAVDSSSR